MRDPRTDRHTGWQGFDRLVRARGLDRRLHPGRAGPRQNTDELYLYEATDNGGFRSGVRIGSGWNGLELVTGVGDFNGDGHPDLVARHTDGDLYLFRGNGVEGFLPNMRLGYNWQAINTLRRRGRLGR